MNCCDLEAVKIIALFSISMRFTHADQADNFSVFTLKISSAPIQQKMEICLLLAFKLKDDSCLLFSWLEGTLALLIGY